MSLLTLDEAFAFLQDGVLPENFSLRLQNVLEFESCPNCDGVCCMHFVLRDWWAPDFDACDGYCCPFCGNWRRGEAAAEAVGVFLRSGERLARYDADCCTNAAFAALGLA